MTTFRLLFSPRPKQQRTINHKTNKSFWSPDTIFSPLLTASIIKCCTLHILKGDQYKAVSEGGTNTWGSGGVVTGEVSVLFVTS